MVKKNFGKGIDAIFDTKEANEKKITSSEKKKEIKDYFKNCCVQIEFSQLEKFKAVAYWERIQQKSLLKKALEMYFNTLDKEYIENAIQHYKNR